MLRVGVWLNSYDVPAWVAQVIQDVQSCEFARIELVILDKDATTDSSPHGAHASVGPNLFQRFEYWDYKRNRSDQDALAITDVRPLLQELPSAFVQSTARIREIRLDAIFEFSLEPIHGDVLNTARFGVWAFRFARSPAGFWEIYDRNPVTSSSLLMLTEPPDAQRVICESQASTDLTSLYRSRSPILWKMAGFALRGLRKLDRQADEFERSLPVAPIHLHPGTGRSPNLQHMAIYLARHVSRSLVARKASLRDGPRKKWNLAVRKRSLNLTFDDPAGYQVIPSPGDRFYADPMLVERDGKTFLFFEDFRFAEGRAVISYCELGADGHPTSQPAEVLRRPFHLSYPFIFEHEGEMYMIPETKGNRRIELFRATRFPDTWVSEAVLLDDVYAVDATVYQDDQMFWMFASVSNGKYSNCDELSLFFSTSLRGPWKPHPQNPLISDVRRARPAGALFYDNGRLIRPSQDSSKAYGYALVFSEVVTLTTDSYEEKLICRLNPESVPGNIANHTYNRTKEFEVIDRDLLIDKAKSNDLTTK